MTIWNQFFTDNEISAFEHQLTSQDAVVSPLLHHSLLRIDGPDAYKFLQGQVTCDINQLTPQNTLRGAQCTLKGRVILSFTALAPTPETILLRISKDLSEQAAANLKKYMVFSKAKLSDLGDEYLSFFFSEEAALTQFADQLNIRRNTAGCEQEEGVYVANVRPNEWELWVPISLLSPAWALIKANTKFGGVNHKLLADIAAGEPDIALNTYELFTPHSLNYPLSGAVSFKKGCYTGQEIVARMHYRGNLQKHTYRFEIDLPQTELPPPGSALQDETGANKGELILSAPRSPTSAELLVYVGDTETDNLYWKEQKLRVLPLPYAIPVTQE